MLRAAALVAVVVAGLVFAAASADARTVWLCRPGMKDNPCATDRTAKVVRADGSTSTARFPADRRRPVDCFYVYPTVSPQETLNSDRSIDAALRGVAAIQASRFSQVCRVWAPVYRQVTVKGLTDPVGARDVGVPLAYGDVRAAWRDYLAHHNQGRGVVLIGHSQGTGMLIRLIAREIDPRPAVRRRLVSALLIGGNVLVPRGRDVGGSFRHVPACRSKTQLGCVVAYSSFLQPPPDPSIFGRGVRSGFQAIFDTPAHGRDLQTLCVNPAAPAGGSAVLGSFFYDDGWTTYPGRYRGHCATAGGATWLQVDPTAGDPRPVVDGRLGPAWGLHGFDVNLTLGDLVDLVRDESAAYARSAG
jgi:hypothetical protein